MDELFLTGAWTLYYHASREKKWSLDSFEKICKVRCIKDVLSVYKELGEKIKAGMYFWMRGDIPPLWENYQNIRGGSYSIRGLGDEGIRIFKLYTLGVMTNTIMVNTEDIINGISISPKLQGFGNQQKIGYFIIKIWNKDSDKFHLKNNLIALENIVAHDDIIYTPHVEKKM